MEDVNKVPVTQTGDEGKDLVPQNIKVERTPAEIAAYNLQKKAEDAKALGLDPKKILGSSDEEVPEWFRKEKAKELQKTSQQLAESIPDEELRTKVKANLARIVPSENPEEDFKFALSAASASKNKQIIEEVGRYSYPRVIATGGSAPIGKIEEEFVPTEEEKAFMGPPWNLSKEKILAQRPKS